MLGALGSEVSADVLGRDRARWVSEGGLGDRGGDLAQPPLDLRAVRKGEKPPIAHKEVFETDLATIVAAEAAAPTELAPDTSDGERQLVREPLVFTLVVVAVVSIVFNVIQAISKG